ncbi:MAG: hypothetical protein ABIJ34_07175 [archaeon]
MAGEINFCHRSLTDVVADCYDVALQIAKRADETGSKEINLFYLRNGGTFPGETVFLILTEILGYNVKTYTPQYEKYGEGRVGKKAMLNKATALTIEQKKEVVNGINKGNLTVILDELIDQGTTMHQAFEDISVYDKEVGLTYDQNMLSTMLFGAVLNRKTPYRFGVRRDHPLKKRILQMHSSFDAPPSWLTFPWETESSHYDSNLDKMIYHSGGNLEPLREYIRPLISHFKR